MIISPRTGAGRTQAGLYVEPGLGSKDLEKKVKMVGDVLATYGCKEVRPDDVVLYRTGMEHSLMDSNGEVLTFIAERHTLVIR